MTLEQHYLVSDIPDARALSDTLQQERSAMVHRLALLRERAQQPPMGGAALPVRAGPTWFQGMLMLSFLMMNAAWSATLREHPSARRPAALPGPHMADRQVTMPPDLDSDSLLMEACRALRANLSAGHDQPLPAALMLLGTAAHTSSALVAAGLAATLAEEGRATLLVDADMRQPVLHQIFGIDQAPGLAEALEDDHHPPQPWQADSRLWVLPAGQPHRNPAEVLRLPSARRCTSALTGRYETVIYHMVEHPTCSDSLLLARHIDAAVLAIQAGVDTAEGARRIKEALERTGSNVLGFAMMEEPR